MEHRSLPTLADVLALEVVQRGQPEVLSHSHGLSRPVRWVHVSELSDIAELLRGGELILTTGIALNSSAAELRRYVDALAQVPVSGLLIELGRRFDQIPLALVNAAERQSIPLVALHREVRFVEVTEAVHTMIVDMRVAQLEASDAAHRRFTDLSVDGASADLIVSTAAALLHRPVILENLTHQVVSAELAEHDPEETLGNWEQRSRFVRADGEGGWLTGDERWTVTSVGGRGERWGRLVMLGADVSGRAAMVLERAAAAVTLNRLLEREQSTLLRQAHHGLLAQICERPLAGFDEVVVRARAVGVPLERRQLVGVHVRFPVVGSMRAVEEQEQSGRAHAELVAQAASRARLPALVDATAVDSVRLLASVSTDADLDPFLEHFAESLRASAGPSVGQKLVIGVGSSVTALGDVRRSLREAADVADAVDALSAVGDKTFHGLPDIRLRGLLTLMRDDSRLQTFVEREVGALLSFDEHNGTALLATLETYLAQGGHKTETARTLYVSRSTLYERLQRIEDILGTRLDQAESRLSLHFALLALASLRRSFDTAEHPYRPRVS